MKLRNTNTSVITILTIAITAMLGLFATNCKKIEPERLIIIKTGTVMDVSQTSCMLSATLLDVGGDQGVTQYGFGFSLTSNIADIAFYSEKGSKRTKGEYTDIVNGLTPGTRYHAWAYASSEGETEYGKSLSFETLLVEKPTLETAGPSMVTFHSAHSGGNILSNGGSEITTRGVCWNTSPTPTIANLRSSDGAGAGEFVSEILELTPETKYYVRAYATNSVGTAYGNEHSFTTLVKPVPAELTTDVIENITWNAASGGGNIISDGGSWITARGVCWNTSPEPNTDHAITTDGSGTGPFGSNLTPLDQETTYYVRAYATNEVGTAYGNEQVFTTPMQPIVPEVITHEIASIDHTGAWCGGTISSNGGAPILSKGLCWSATVSEPTLADASNEFGNNSDPFDMEIAGLDHNTEYFVRAYATNMAGTGYGEPVAFRTPFLCGSQLEDERDGKTYFTVGIGEQCWMGENLNVGVMIDTFDVQGDNGTLEKYCYNNKLSNCDTYGGQYSWDEMMQYTLVEMTQGVCPAGWHIPSDYEWKIMERVLGMTVEESDGTSWRGTDEGGQLKAQEPLFWNPPNTGATNITWFSALPSGMLWNDGSSSGIGDFTVFWTSTFIDTEYAVYRMLHTNESRIDREEGGYRPNTTSVRCVKDKK